MYYLLCPFRYQKTESVVKGAAEKTTSILGGLGSGITMKLGQLKNSESFRSLEEKVGSAYENVKVRWHCVVFFVYLAISLLFEEQNVRLPLAVLSLLHLVFALQSYTLHEV